MTPTSLPIRDCKCESLWNSHRLVGLWEMLAHHCWRLTNAITHIVTLYRQYRFTRPGEGSHQISDSSIAELLMDIQLLELWMGQDKLIVPHCYDQIKEIRKEINSCTEHGFPFTRDTAAAKLGTLLSTIEKEIESLKFVHVPSDRAQFFEQERLFGDAVWRRFSDARQDIKEAGNSICAELGTAAVFHLMRAAESAIFSLARFCGVTDVPAPGGHGRRQEISIATWGRIITEIKRVVDLGFNTTSAKRKSADRFCNKVLISLRGFQNAWRDDVMHNGPSYSMDQAISILGHVRDLMITMAENGIGQSSRKRLPPP